MHRYALFVTWKPSANLLFPAGYSPAKALQGRGMAMDGRTTGMQRADHKSNHSLVICYSLLLKMAIEIMDFPTENCDFL